jgi:hypothetical protein
MKSIKVKFGGFVIAVVAILQGVAWYCGKNGTVFAFTSFVIGGIAGAVFGFGVKKIEESNK